MPKKVWTGAPNSFYPSLYTVLQPGDVIDVPAEILAADPGRWAAVPAEAKSPGKAQADTPEGEVS